MKWRRGKVRPHPPFAPPSTPLTREQGAGTGRAATPPFTEGAQKKGSPPPPLPPSSSPLLAWRTGRANERAQSPPCLCRGRGKVGRLPSFLPPLQLHSRVNRLREWNGQRPPICEGAQSGSLPSPPPPYPQPPLARRTGHANERARGPPRLRRERGKVRPPLARQLHSCENRTPRTDRAGTPPPFSQPPLARRAGRANECARGMPRLRRGRGKVRPPFAPQPHSRETRENRTRERIAQGSPTPPPPLALTRGQDA